VRHDRRVSRWTGLGLAILIAAGAGLAAPAHAGTRWLCKPGIRDNPCRPSQSTTRFAPDGSAIGVQRLRNARRPAIDCFYVYPTASDQAGPLARRIAEPAVRSIALYQAARFGRFCRVFAPLYRQTTVPALFGGSATARGARTAYGDVRAAWRSYLRRYNHGRGVVLIGHSQGTFVLRRLVADELDPKPRARARLVSAILLGGDVKTGEFAHIPACRSPRQLRCVIAYSTYGAPPETDAVFGRSASARDPAWGIKPRPGARVLCTNPAALAGGSGKADFAVPREPFGGQALAAGLATMGVPAPAARTAWIDLVQGYTTRCISRNGFHVLLATPRGGWPALRPTPAASWGLHLLDANIALGNLASIVRRQAREWASRAGSARTRRSCGRRSSPAAAVCRSVGRRPRGADGG
jgi:hypothetical protein